MATGSGANTLLRERRELMFLTLTTEQVAGIRNRVGAAPWVIEPDVAGSSTAARRERAEHDPGSASGRRPPATHHGV